MKKYRLPVSLLLLVSLFCLFCFPSEGLAAENTVIRVLMTRLKLTDRIDLSLDGSYSIDSLAFQRGSAVTVSCASGRLMVYYEGIAFEHGTSLRLVRHPASGGGENGLRIDHTYPLHPGDLLLTVQDSSLRAVLYIDVEDYLCGVVPYEMSDTYPLEALKAQAVAARTYAMNKKNISSSLDYDVTDNTNDQVYYGIQKEHVFSERAVRETARICGLTADGDYAQCYYCASNGGQTETVSRVWGTADLPYLVMRSDPYDLENPYATVRTCELRKSAPDESPLRSLLLPQAEAALRERGIDPESAQWKTVSAVKPVMPACEGSLCFTGLQMDLTVEYPVPETEEEVYFDPAADPQETPPATAVGTASVPVTLPVFPELLAACDLTINPGSNNELISVRETDDAFVIESRRYGHGVGMSQRGAQWMALKYGMTCTEILDFYYPGLRFAAKPGETAAPAATEISMDFLATPGPAASPTPRPTLIPVDNVLSGTLRLVSVTNISENSSLNLRALPNINSPVICQLYYGQLLSVTEDLEGGWLHVKTDAVEGYVFASYVQDVPEAPSP